MADRPSRFRFSNRIEIEHPASFRGPANLDNACMAEPRLSAREIHITAEAQRQVDVGSAFPHAQIEA